MCREDHHAGSHSSWGEIPDNKALEATILLVQCALMARCEGKNVPCTPKKKNCVNYPLVNSLHRCWWTQPGWIEAYQQPVSFIPLGISMDVTILKCGEQKAYKTLEHATLVGTLGTSTVLGWRKALTMPGANFRHEGARATDRALTLWGLRCF